MSVFITKGMSRLASPKPKERMMESAKKEMISVTPSSVKSVTATRRSVRSRWGISRRKVRRTYRLATQ